MNLGIYVIKDLSAKLLTDIYNMCYCFSYILYEIFVFCLIASPLIIFTIDAIIYNYFDNNILYYNDRPTNRGNL